MADPTKVVRVVAVRRGLRATEFAIRPGEEGLSLFACETIEDAERIVAAVRSAGKRGPLAAAAIMVEELVALGLELVATPGGTPDPLVNQWHVEARLDTQSLDQARRLGQAPAEFYNQQLAGAVGHRARIVYEE